ncbi:MAG TPA: LysR family transcriptional regulator [Hyphomicrobiales bacterium]|nr:LysR family transcriptional regulator [Hyphomicrobiales bacterium]
MTKLTAFDLNLIVALDALLRERSVTRAGEMVGLSQSAMSGVLGRLRHSFKDDLLVRVGRRLELTPLAEELLEPVSQCVAQLTELVEQRPAFDPAEAKRTFAVAATDYAAFLLLQPLLQLLATEAPGIAVRMIQLEPDTVDRLGTGEVDFLIMPSEIETRFPGELLFIDRCVCAVWKGHPEVGDSLSEAQYLALPHLTFGMDRPSGRSVADQHLEKIGLKRNVVATAEGFLIAPFLLKGTRMVTLVHRRLGERVQAAAEIRLVEPPMELPEIHESVFWSPQNSRSPAHLWFRAKLVEVARALDRNAAAALPA